MQVGFVIDQRKCIGCHACTVACKSENEVPVGSFRTWVKYTDKGTFPNVRRHFSVLRCNHCDDAPCVEICPVEALHKRPDAIVDLDRSLCIGCRACMQACPYDALYLNADTGTAEKCHYCAHRVERGMEPACVIVCPVHAIISGDTTRPDSEIATILRDQPTSQRRVDKATRPRVWYVDALEESLVPGAATEPPIYLWSDRQAAPLDLPPDLLAPADVVTALNAPHQTVWGWHIWVYLTTKNIAAGVLMFAPFLSWLGVASGSAAHYLPELTALVFLGITTFLLVHDLGRPERFLKIIFHPNTRSWLVKGAWVLMGFGGLATMSLVARWFGRDDLAEWLRWINLPFAVMSSGYSAWLFAQCRGRDLWLESGLFFRLILRAALFGALFTMVLPSSGGGMWRAPGLLFLVLGVVEIFWLGFESRHKPSTLHARQARDLMNRDPDTRNGRLLLLTAELAAMASLLLGTPAAATVEIGVLLLFTAGILLLERSWITNGQKVSIS